MEEEVLLSNEPGAADLSTSPVEGQAPVHTRDHHQSALAKLTARASLRGTEDQEEEAQTLMTINSVSCLRVQAMTFLGHALIGGRSPANTDSNRFIGTHLLRRSERHTGGPSAQTLLRPVLGNPEQ